MNETYLIIMGAFVVYTLTQLFTGAIDSDNFGRHSTTFVAFLISLSLITLSLIADTGDDFSIIEPATNTQVGDVLIIQAEGEPTQVITDIKFMDKPVELIVTRKHNAWGFYMDTEYEVVIKTEL